MAILGVVTLFTAATSEASAQILDGIGDLLFGPLRPEAEEEIALEEAGRLVRRQSPEDPSGTTTAVGQTIPTQGDAVPDTQDFETLTPTPTDDTQPAGAAAPPTGPAPDSIPALW
mgnify:CR=1 FL=1